MGDRDVGGAYDAIARVYDRQLEDDLWMRRILWERYTRVFREGDRVLDVGCGTGTDAVFLARHGVRVTGIDVSPAMIAQAKSKIAGAGVSPLVQLAVLDITELSRLRSQEFDGIISSFAVLNTLPTLTTFAADAARLVRPDGRMILHLLNRSSLWEWGGLVARGRWTAARQLGRRGERTVTIGGKPVRHYLPRAGEVYERDFAPDFRLCGIRALGITRPPSRIGPLPDIVLAALGRLDERIAAQRPVIGWGRFFLLEMSRRNGESAP